jgi:hypothetical protein
LPDVPVRLSFLAAPVKVLVAAPLSGRLKRLF